jgi:hypothetical protein
MALRDQLQAVRIDRQRVGLIADGDLAAQGRGGFGEVSLGGGGGGGGSMAGLAPRIKDCQ